MVRATMVGDEERPGGVGRAVDDVIAAGPTGSSAGRGWVTVAGRRVLEL